MRILHGLNTTASRQRLALLIEAAKSKSLDIQKIEAKNLSFSELESQLHSESLFESEVLLVIEGLLSLPASKNKETLINLVVLSQKEKSKELILWESKLISATILNNFPKDVVDVFKPTVVLFKWLDSLGAGQSPSQKRNSLNLFKQTILQDDVYLALTLLIRQVRLLLKIKDGNTYGVKPYMISKLQAQAHTFTESKLLSIHHQLLELDVYQKSSTVGVKFESKLEQLIYEM